MLAMALLLHGGLIPTHRTIPAQARRSMMKEEACLAVAVAVAVAAAVTWKDPRA
jgi:hypothetical protein